MTAITNSFRPFLAAYCPRDARGFAAPTAEQEYRVLFGLTLAFLAGGAALVIHGLGTLVAFN